MTGTHATKGTAGFTRENHSKKSLRNILVVSARGTRFGDDATSSFIDRLSLRRTWLDAGTGGDDSASRRKTRPSAPELQPCRSSRGSRGYPFGSPSVERLGPILRFVLVFEGVVARLARCLHAGHVLRGGCGGPLGGDLGPSRPCRVGVRCSYVGEASAEGVHVSGGERGTHVGAHPLLEGTWIVRGSARPCARVIGQGERG